MSSKSKKKPTHEMSLSKAINYALVIFVWAFVSAFDPTGEQFDRLKQEVQSVRDSVMCGALTIGQIHKALKDEFDIEIM